MREVESNMEPWYRNPWVWLIIAIPGLTVIGCAFTIFLAITNPEILVSGVNTSLTILASMTEAAGLG